MDACTQWTVTSKWNRFTLGNIKGSQPLTCSKHMTGNNMKGSGREGGYRYHTHPMEGASSIQCPYVVVYIVCNILYKWPVVTGQ